jgi:cell division protease FtsH
MEIARMTPGFSGAELANVINEAALLAVRQGQVTIDQPTLEEAIDRVVSGPAKKSHVLSAREREVISIHEASHAVVARAIGQTMGGGAQKLSIVSRGRTLGTATSQLIDKDVTVQQQADLERQLTAIVSGAAGERVHFGMLSTAINDDLHAATNLARSMVTSFGMSPELGLVTIGEQGGEVFLGASLQELGSVGPATLELIDREIERIVAEAVERAEIILRANWPTVRETAQVLLDHETVSGVALEALLTPVEPIEIEDVRLNGRRPVE